MHPVKPRQKAVRVRSTKERLERLFQVFSLQDKVLITIDADPDSMASAIALKRLLRERVTSVTLAHFNRIMRSDNLSMVELLRIPLVKLQAISPNRFCKIVLVDGQPYHHEAFNDFNYDLVIDHHPKTMPVKADFVDIRPDYGATATIMAQYLRSAKIRPSERLAIIVATIPAQRPQTPNSRSAVKIKGTEL
jgi:nanoRNase/pAp phosphatase (c-di-AMP/oligoRNAs hydrolase)